ncbi:hypothetical protein FOPG_19040 [Fusarium oxysporum f. sp. conglutinans race 2 54008]|uniref:Uncharacterized protein n=1 Tax=Fusarium oxysporum f. sp. conglutinans race 2 54008 TaxID=1089457 RepID=X0GN34_FUSOX|nr:hypothetical protein FOPG_19040 [Fusarium oxysporum f. sp. conglutinans race 2 54008]
MYHAEGDINNALVQFEYNEIRESIAFEKSLDRGSTLQNYLEFVPNRGNRKRLFILFWTVCMAQMPRIEPIADSHQYHPANVLVRYSTVLYNTSSKVLAGNSSNKAAAGAIVVSAG